MIANVLENTLIGISISTDQNMEHPDQTRTRTLVVIGNGMVGHRFCEHMVELDIEKRHQLIVIGEEPRVAYDRVHLTSYLATGNADDLALSSKDWYQSQGIRLLTHERVSNIDVDAQRITTDAGNAFHYDAAVLATGSRPFVPSIAGINLPRVYVYRTIEDLDAIALAAKTSRRAAVIGGGLLGLEAAKALLDLGVPTRILEAAPRLMPRQLDASASSFLLRHIEQLGVEVQTGVQLVAVQGQDCVQGIELGDGEVIDVDLVVVSAGIRPRDELARAAGIDCHARGGIIVNDSLLTSDAHVYAIGECACHGNTVYGLVGPGYSMAQALARRITGDEAAAFSSADTSTQLKLLGVDVASFGDPFADERTRQSVVLQNFVSGVYQKLALSEDGSRLLGGILVGDASRYASLISLQRSGRQLSTRAEALLVEGIANSGSVCANDDDLVCTCNSVTRGAIIEAVRGRGCVSFGDVKAKTRAGTGCGGCASAVTDMVQSQLIQLGKATKKRICEHFDYTRQELFEIIRVKNYTAFDALLTDYGTGLGCEICKPAVASILASIHNEFILEHESLQDTNDRYLANIQRRGLYSVIPRIAGGEITPEKLLVIAQVAQKYGLYTKITGAQRIDMFGATLSQLPAIWEELVEAGFESGHAYGKALRTVKSCVGSTWCRFGVNDSVGFAIRVENRYKGIRAPHKLKSAVSGCIRECAEAQSKDFGLIATENGWNLYVCGNGGAQPRHADLLATGVDDEMAIKVIDRFLMYYIRTADRLTRTAKWIEQMEGGLSHLKDVIINDSLGICSDLERDLQHLVDTYQCEWAEVVHNPKLCEKFRENANDNDDPPLMVPVRGQAQPASWPKGEALASRRHLPLVQSSWVPLAKATEFPKDTGVTYRFGRAQIAVFHISKENRWYATQAACPHKGDAVLGRGILGDSCGTPKVACPFHKRTFSLETGQCTSGEGVGIITFPVRVEGGVVQVELPAIQELEALLTFDLPPCEEHPNKVSTAAQ